MKTNRGIGVPVHAFFTSTLDVDLPTPRLSCFSGISPRNLFDISLGGFRSLSMSRRGPD